MLWDGLRYRVCGTLEKFSLTLPPGYDTLSVPPLAPGVPSGTAHNHTITHGHPQPTHGRKETKL